MARGLLMAAFLEVAKDQWQPESCGQAVDFELQDLAQVIIARGRRSRRNHHGRAVPRSGAAGRPQRVLAHAVRTAT